MSRFFKRKKQTKGIVRALSSSGRWDVIAEVEAGDMKALTGVALRINGLSGVRTTETLVEAVLGEKDSACLRLN